MRAVADYEWYLTQEALNRSELSSEMYWHVVETLDASEHESTNLRKSVP